MELCAFARLTIGKHTPMVVFHDLFTDGQANACAFVSGFIMQALEHLENAFTELLFKPDAVVGKNEVIIF